mmetsp:Transcript_6544/g.13902  ORF Transcript_6544/g.13902 Transcript_6544/m.13902 type:complete len:458 (-) Transcript_6544:540-1913(-)
MEQQHREGEDDEEYIFHESKIPKVFEDLDQSFRCRICSNLFNKAVTIKACGHNFCSVCIRSYWVAVRRGAHRQERACPLCRTIVNAMDVDKALVMNRSIQDSVKSFKQILLNHHRSSKHEIEDSPPPRSGRRRRIKLRKASANLDYKEDSLGDKRNNIDKICGNEDLQEPPIQRKMQSRNYGRMKKTELQRLCKEYNIPTSGNEQELMDRMRKFQSMWNAEVDSIEPKTPSDLAAELKKELQAQRDERKRALITGAAGDMKYMEKFNENIKSGNITSGNADFDKKIKANFDSLVNQLQKRKQKEPESSINAFKSSSDTKNGSGENGSHNNPLSDGIKDQLSMMESSGSSFDVIDIDSCSDKPHTEIRTSTVARKNTNDAFNSRNTPPPPIRHATSSCIANSKTTTPVVEHPAKNQKRKRSFPSPSVPMNRVNWACDRCTYVNIGIDYVCQICSYRKA